MIKKVIKGLFKAIVKKHSDERYILMGRVSNFFYPFFCHTERGKFFLDDKKFIKEYNKFDKWNYNSIDRKYNITQLLKLTQGLSGDLAECGCFTGGTAYFMLKNMNTKKTLHLFDSFEGLSNPDTVDGTHWNLGSLSCSEYCTKENLKDFKNVKYYRGWIPEQFYNVQKIEFSFIHIDVDLYQPTKDSLEFFYSRLQKGGIIVCDDYGFNTCPGAKKAFDEFAKKNDIQIIGLSSGQGFIIKK